MSEVDAADCEVKAKGEGGDRATEALDTDTTPATSLTVGGIVLSQVEVLAGVTSVDLDLAAALLSGASVADPQAPSPLTYQGRRLSLLEAAEVVERVRPLGTRRRRVGGGFQNEVLDPRTNAWINADR